MEFSWLLMEVFVEDNEAEYVNVVVCSSAGFCWE